MKRVLYLLVFMMCIGGVAAYAQTDSVKIKLKTSNGAEISLDGDVSSTNILTKLVPVGKHVVGISYGFDYSKTHEIDVVKGGQTEFEFLVEGKLVLSSVPSNSDVSVDGLPMGKTPLEMNLLGRHNISVIGNKDLFYPYNITLEVMPEQAVEHNAVLKKRPAKLYGFVLANYMISAGAPGIMLGAGRRFGGYIKVNVDPDVHDMHEGDGDDDQPYSTDKLTKGSYKKESIFDGASAGIVFRASPNLWTYIGAGYGEYSGASIEKYLHDERVHEVVRGAMLDLGIMAKWKALLFNIGYSRILGASDYGHHFGDLNVGIGITIHKEKKHK